MAQLGRLITAMVTPFDAKGAVDYETAKRLALALLDSGSDGLVVCGTTGESPTLSHAEKLRLFGEIKGAVGTRGSVIAGTGSSNTAESVETTKEAEALGVDAALLVVPSYNKPTPEGLYRHFKAIAESAKLPCILYNVPSRTVTNLLPETVARLAADVPNIIGIKEACGNMEQVRRLVQSVRRKDFLVWSGNDNDTYPMMELGCYGVVAVASHLIGAQLKEMVNHAAHHDFAKAKAIHEHLTPLFRDLFVVTNPIPVKYALNQVGFPVGGYRLPMCEPDAASAEKIMATVRTYQIDLPTESKPKVAAKS